MAVTAVSTVHGEIKHVESASSYFKIDEVWLLGTNWLWVVTSISKLQPMIWLQKTDVLFRVRSKLHFCQDFHWTRNLVGRQLLKMNWRPSKTLFLIVPDHFHILFIITINNKQVLEKKNYNMHRSDNDIRPLMMMDIAPYEEGRHVCAVLTRRAHMRWLKRFIFSYKHGWNERINASSSSVSIAGLWSTPVWAIIPRYGRCTMVGNKWWPKLV